MPRNYEIMFIVAPNATDEEIDKIIAQMEGVVQTTHGEVLKVEKLSKRKLAYRIEKFEEGYYLLFNINGTGEMVKEFERRLKVTDAVIRYVTVRTDETSKRVEKIREARLRKVRRKSPGVQPECTVPGI